MTTENVLELEGITKNQSFALEERDRMEDAGTDFHVRVREGFLALAARDAERYLVLEARDDREANRVRVRERVGVLLGLSEASGSMEA